MSCCACTFPYSLCQCPVTVTAGELAGLRVENAELRAKLQRAERQPQRFCSVEDCDSEPDSTGFCERHGRKAAAP